MAPKRRSAAMALLPRESQPPEYHTAGSPGTSLRRSARSTKKPGEGPRVNDDEDTREGSSNNNKNSNARTRRQRSYKIEQDNTKSEKGVKSAINGLQVMEDNLLRAVKRQKLAISQSSITGAYNERDDEGTAFDSRPRKSSPDVLPADKLRVLRKSRSTSSRDSKKRNGHLNPKEEDAVKQEDKDEDVDFGADRGLSGEEGEEENDIEAIKQQGARPPPVNSDYLPLPWKGRLGYACLNTYLRQSNPPVFCSRTCRIASIIEHRHPLMDPSQPEHATKNRPDKTQPADLVRGQKYVENLCLANVRDIPKMLRWNDKYGIKLMRLSSEMFPFASHEEYGYKLAPFASEALAEAGKVAAELGHRLTTHPGQFTQLGSPRAEVVRNAVRDLEYHDEMLSLLKLPEQQNRDAVMILHMGGVFGDKAATVERFKENYAKLSDSIKARLVLENDDVCWHVHDILPICEELNIPLVLDYHHHNILFDETQIREGTRDVVDLYPRIRATWARKGIRQKMHYSEPCSEAVTPRQRRKHRPRVMTLPPCPDDMDLMIEAKDKEQAVFDLMRNFRLPGWDSFNDVVPYEREDDNRPPPRVAKKKQQQQQQNKSRKKKSSKQQQQQEGEDVEMDDGDGAAVAEEETEQPPPVVPEEEVGMGGPQNRVYWPVGMEDWLRPKKREVKKKPPPTKKGEEDEE